MRRPVDLPSNTQRDLVVKERREDQTLAQGTPVPMTREDLVLDGKPYCRCCQMGMRGMFMGPVRISRPTQEELDEMGVGDWPIWEKEVSEFPWFYSESETFYVLEGRVRVELDEGEPVEFGKGDLVTFPEGTGCTWKVEQPIRKHYRFG